MSRAIFPNPDQYEIIMPWTQFGSTGSSFSYTVDFFDYEGIIIDLNIFNGTAANLGGNSLQMKLKENGNDFQFNLTGFSMANAVPAAINGVPFHIPFGVTPYRDVATNPSCVAKFYLDAHPDMVYSSLLWEAASRSGAAGVNGFTSFGGGTLIASIKSVDEILIYDAGAAPNISSLSRIRILGTKF